MIVTEVYLLRLEKKNPFKEASFGVTSFVDLFRFFFGAILQNLILVDPWNK